MRNPSLVEPLSTTRKARRTRLAIMRTALAVLIAVGGAASIDVIVRAQSGLVGPGGPGQNINVVTGSDNQFVGDLFRQRQQEEVIAISGVNSAHMIVGYNDFRTIDFQHDTGVGTQGPAGLLAKLSDFFRRPWQRERDKVSDAAKAAAANAAWMGFSITDNGGKSWYSGLHPGGGYADVPPPNFPPFPGDEAWKLDSFNSASDPVVGATHNEFFFGGIAFNPPVSAGGDGKGIGFVSRFTDYNDTETGQNIRFDGTRVLLKSDDFVSAPGVVPKFFVDKPSVAAAPGAPGGKAYVYAAFVVFDQSDPAKLSSKILFFRSTNSGETWSAPITVSQPLSRNQSPWIVIDPNNPANVYIGWRVFANPLYPNLTNAIVGKRSTNAGASFTTALPYPVALLLKSFDQPQGNMSPPNPTFPSPRSAAYPTATIDGNGAIHVLVQEYVYPANYPIALLRGLPLAPGSVAVDRRAAGHVDHVIQPGRHMGGPEGHRPRQWRGDAVHAGGDIGGRARTFVCGESRDDTLARHRDVLRRACQRCRGQPGNGGHRHRRRQTVRCARRASQRVLDQWSELQPIRTGFAVHA